MVKTLGTALDRNFRNDNNDNFTEHENDIQAVDNRVSDVQEQLDVLVVSGDSSPAANQARVDADGFTYSSLKARIDAEQNKIGIVQKNKVNVLSKGADATGVQNSTQAFKDAITEVQSKITNDANIFTSNLEGNAVIELPAGTFLISDDNPQLLSATASRTRGLVIKGAGRGVTKVLFKPTVSNGYLFYNNDKWLSIHFEGITFIGDFTKSTNFMRSYSTGGAQNYTFDKCDFFDFQYGYKLEGTNVNSEMTWFHCGFYYNWGKVIYAESTTASDQFLNYNFYSCQFEAAQGDFLHFDKGGNINIWGGSFIHTSATAGTFFRLKSGAHAYGVQRFLCIGARFEHKYNASALIECDWNDGVVSFINCDSSSQTGITGASTMHIAKFTSSNQKMPSIKFDNCSLMGQHEYVYNSSSYNYPHNVVYENCEFTNATKRSDFVVYTALGTNSGGQPTINFRNCRGILNDRTQVWEGVYNFDKSSTAIISKKIVSIKDANSKFPINGGTVEVYLPLNAIITKITLYSPSGAVSEVDAATFSVQTFEATPTTLATITATNHSQGFTLHQDTFFVCNADDKRHLKLVAGSDVSQYNGSALCLIEYIG